MKKNKKSHGKRELQNNVSNNIKIIIKSIKVRVKIWEIDLKITIINLKPKWITIEFIENCIIQF